MSDSASVTLTKVDNEGTKVDNNILVGSDTSVAKTGKQYVLGVKGGVLNFYLFDGTAIPAGRAYYVNE